jgi:hypothetical protein
MCGPIVGLAAIEGPHERAITLACLAYNRSVIDYLRTKQSVEVVVVTGSFIRFFGSHSRFAEQGSQGLALSPPNREALARALHQTIEQVKRLGKRVVLLGPAPNARYDLARCWERTVQRIRSFGPFRGCPLSDRTLLPEQYQVLAVLQRAAELGDVPLIRLDRVLCPNGRCVTQLRGRSLYLDSLHLTDDGSLELGRRMNLGALVWRSAR